MHSSGGMGRAGSGRTNPKPLTEAAVRKMLKARGLKATPAELADLTRMMNADLEREAAEAEAAAALERHSKMVDRFMAQFVGDPEPRAGRRAKSSTVKAAKKAAKKGGLD